MERPHRQYFEDSAQHRLKDHVLTNSASTAMQSHPNPNSRQNLPSYHPSHQSKRAQARTQTQAHTHLQGQSHIQLGRDRLSSTTSGAATFTQPPRTYESSDPSYNLNPDQSVRNEEMDLMAPWGRSANMPYMQDTYSHATATTQLTAMAHHLQAPMSILSAETYQPGAPKRIQSSRPRQQSYSQHPGNSSVVAGAQEQQAMQHWGLMRANGSETSSGAKPQKRKASAEGEGKGKKKKQKVEPLSEDDEAKKSRGRPRLDPKDETPADRRRTQIRNAQRAYRHRKETTISTLEAQVQDLKGTNEEMSNIFTNLYDMAVKNGLLQREPDFGRQLTTATEKFYTLVRSASVDSEQKDDEPVASESRHSSTIDEQPFSNPNVDSRNLDQTKDVPQSSTTIDVWGYQIPANTHVGQENIDYASMSYGTQPHTQEQHNNNLTVITRATEDNASLLWDLPQSYDQEQANDHTVITRATEDNASFPFDFWPDMQTFNADVPPLEDYSNFIPSQSLPLPKSHAYSETYFSRRLHRTALEAAVTLITMPSPPPTRYEEVFGFCLRFESKFAIELRLRSCLERTAKESTHMWGAPFVHLGGAGTHYPVDSIEMASSSMPKFRTGLSMGPFEANVTDVRNQYVTNDLQIKLPGFEGSFFDANDVDGYLRGKGIEIHPDAEFVEVDAEALSEYDDYHSPSNSSDEEPPMPRTPLHRQEGPVHGVLDTTASHATHPRIAHSVPSSQPSNTSDAGKESTLAFSDPPNTTVGISAPSNAAGLHAAYFKDDFDWSFEKDVQALVANGGFGLQRRKTLKLEVATLMQAIMRGALCLGRAPGFRPVDVDYAIRISVRDARARGF